MMFVREIWREDEKERPQEKLLFDLDETETIALGYVSVDSGKTTKAGFHDDEEEIM